MQNEIDRQLRKAQELESAANPEAAIAAYSAILARSPNLISAHLRLSELWQRTGQYRRSLASAESAAGSIELTKRWEALPFVTMRLLAFGERSLVRRLIAAADWRHPSIIGQSPVLSQHLWLSDAYDEALDLIGAAMAKVPPNPLLSYSRANALRYSGRMQEATEELERCLALAPNFAFAHWTLANHAPSDPPGIRVDRVRKAMQATTSDPMAQIHLNYALFKELDDAGDTTNAWHALATGARLKRQSISYDPQGDADSVEALCALAERVAAGVADADRPAGHTPIFVVGMPRTGTTLLERILSNHECVASAGELVDFAQALGWVTDRFIGTPPGLPTVQALRKVDYAALGQRYVAKTSGYAAGRPFLLDKNPANVFHAWAIAKALPHARILCLVRDPVDACFSNFKELFSGPAYGYSYDLRELAGHHRLFSKIVERWASLFPDRFKVIRYEELVTNTERAVGDVAAFCGLESRADLADITRNASPVLTASNAQVKQPIHTRNIGGWRRYGEQLQSLEQALAHG